MDYIQLISSELFHGNYQKSRELISKLPKDHVDGLYYESRILELTGHFERGLEVANRITVVGETAQELLMGKIAISYCDWRLGNFDKTIEMLKPEEVENIDEIIDPSFLATFYNILGLIHWKIGNNQDALSNFEQACEIRKKHDLKAGLSYSINNLGNTYLNMGELEYARKFYLEAKEIREKLGIRPAIAASYNSIARYSEVLKDYSTALKNHTKSLKIWEGIGNHQFIAKSHRFLGIYYLNVENFSQSRYHLDQALKMFQGIPNITDSSLTSDLLKKVNSLIS